MKRELIIWPNPSAPARDGLEILKGVNNVKRIVAQLVWLVSILAPAHVWAAGTGSAGLPWEQPLALVARSLTGPVALSIAIVALMAAGGILVFGGELNEFARRACIAVLAIAFLVAGSGFMTMLFGVSAGLV